MLTQKCQHEIFCCFNLLVFTEIGKINKIKEKMLKYRGKRENMFCLILKSIKPELAIKEKSRQVKE